MPPILPPLPFLRYLLDVERQRGGAPPAPAPVVPRASLTGIPLPTTGTPMPGGPPFRFPAPNPPTADDVLNILAQLTPPPPRPPTPPPGSIVLPNGEVVSTLPSLASGGPMADQPRYPAAPPNPVSLRLGPTPNDADLMLLEMIRNSAPRPSADLAMFRDQFAASPMQPRALNPYEAAATQTGHPDVVREEIAEPPRENVPGVLWRENRLLEEAERTGRVQTEAAAERVADEDAILVDQARQFYAEADAAWLQANEDYAAGRITEEEFRIAQRQKAAAEAQLTAALNRARDTSGETVGANILGGSLYPLNVLLEWNQGQAGEDAYQIATGQGEGTISKVIPNVTDFEGWTKDPANWPRIRDVYLNGYTAPNGERFEPGGFAVWQLFQSTQSTLERGISDIVYDPLFLPSLLAPAGRGLHVAGTVVREGGEAAAESAVRRGAREVAGTTFEVAGQTLQAPQRALDATVDAILPAVIKAPLALDRAIGAALGRGEEGVLLGPIVDWATSPAARTAGHNLLRRMKEVYETGVRQRAAQEAAPTIEPDPGRVVAGKPGPIIDPDTGRVVVQGEGPIITPETPSSTVTVTPRTLPETETVSEPVLPLARAPRRTAAGRSVIEFDGNPPVRIEIRQGVPPRYPVAETPEALIPPEAAEAVEAAATTGERITPSPGENVPSVVQRIEDVGVAPGRVDKPQGLYTSPEDVASPHAGLGGTRRTLRTNPEANVLRVESAGLTRGPRGLAGDSAGMSALRTLLGPDEARRFAGMTREAAVATASREFPVVNWTRYTDTQEVLEAYVGMKARAAGYDAIWQVDRAAPEFSEYVGLTERAFAPVDDFSDLPPYLRVDTRPNRVRVKPKGVSFVDAAGGRAKLAQYVADVAAPVRPVEADEFLQIYARMARDKITIGGPNSAEEALGNIGFYGRHLVPLYEATVTSGAVPLPRYRWQYGAKPGGSEANLIEHVVFGTAGSTTDQALVTLAGKAANDASGRLVARVQQALRLRAEFREDLGDVLPQLFGEGKALDLPTDVPLIFRATAAGTPSGISDAAMGIHPLSVYKARREVDRLAERAIADQVQQAASTPLPGGVTRDIPRSTEDLSFLNTRFVDHPEHAGKTYGQVADEYTAEIVEGRRLLARQQGAGLRTAGLPGIGPRFGVTLSPAETKRLATLTTRWEGSLPTSLSRRAKPQPGEMASGALSSTEDPGLLAVNAMERDFLAETGYADRRTKFGRGWDTARQLYSETRLLLPWNFARYLISNQSDALRYLIAGYPEAALKSFDARNWKEAYKYAASGRPSSLVDSPIAQFHQQAEIGVPYGLQRSITSAEFGEGSSAYRRVFGKAGARAGGIAGKPIEILRDLERGLEFARRGSLHTTVMRKGMIREQRAFRAHVRELARRRNVAIPDAVLEQGIRDLGPIYGPGALRTRLEKLALKSGASGPQAYGFADRAARDWRSVQNRLLDDAGGVVNKTAFSYEYTNLDELISRFVPFHFYATRALRFYAEEGLRHPGMMAAYFRALEGIEEHAEEYGLTGGFLKLWNTPTGWTLFFHPMAALGILDVFDDVGRAPDGESMLGKVLRNIQQHVGIAPYPWISSLLNYAGFLGDSFVGLDPVGMYRERSLFQTVINVLGTHGWLGDDWEGLVGVPLEQRFNNLRGKLSSLVPDWVPGASPVPATNVNAYPMEQVDARIAELYRQANNIPDDAVLTEAQMEEIIAIQANPDHPMHQTAEQDYADAAGWQAVLSTFIPGPLRRRQTGEAQRRGLVSEAYDTPAVTVGGLSGLAVDPYEDTFLTDEELTWLNEYEQVTGKPYVYGDLATVRDQRIIQDRINNAPPQTKPYLLEEFGYYHLGTQAQRDLLDTENDIAYGTLDAPVVLSTRGQPSSVGGRRYTNAELQAMTPEARRALADQWIAVNDPAGSANALRDLRTTYEQTHPAVARYLDWRRDKRAEWPNLTQYREELARGNPNARRFIEQEQAKLRKKYGANLTPTILEEELDRAILSLEGFLAVDGLPLRYGDKTIAVSDPMAVPYDPKGPNAKEGAGEEETFGGQLARAVPETEALLTRINAELSAEFGGQIDYRNLPPPLRAFVESKYPELASDDVRIAMEYLTWVEMQKAEGKDASQAAYLMQEGWKTVTASGPAPVSNPLDFMPRATQRIMPGNFGAGSFNGQRITP